MTRGRHVAIFSGVPHLAFVTSTQYPQLTLDDRLAATVLERAGIRVSPVVWSDDTIVWSDFDLVVLRSMWDYHLHYAAFQRWLDRLEDSGAFVLNPTALARWNADKRYLRDLRERGIEIVPTVWFERGEEPALEATLAELGWTEAVVKPVISSTAFRTWRVRPADAALHEPEFHALLRDRPAMLQEFQPAILSEGEWSLMFLDGEPSHTVLKRAVNGDFRVQEEFGGTTELAAAPAGALALARRAIAAAGSPWLYARVDGVMTTQGFRLMELEMLEPGLFLLNDAAAPARFARAILRALPAHNLTIDECTP